jgi:enoyl-CoA hydratase
LLKTSGILFDRSPFRVILSLNRPDKLNPLDKGTVKELLGLVKEIEADKSISTVVLTGSGRAFSAGGDLEGYVDLYKDPSAFRLFLNDFNFLLGAIEASEKIYIAAVNGACVAGGLELMLACDLVIASETALIGDGHINFAQLPGAGGSQRLPRAIGSLRAKQMMLMGKMWDAKHCLNIGLLNEVVPSEELLERCDTLAQEFSARSPSALIGAKRLVNEGAKLSLQDSLIYEMDYVHHYATTNSDAMEGLVAFSQKRKPVYKKN